MGAPAKPVTLWVALGARVAARGPVADQMREAERAPTLSNDGLRDLLAYILIVPGEHQEEFARIGPMLQGLALTEPQAVWSAVLEIFLSYERLIHRREAQVLGTALTQAQDQWPAGVVEHRTLLGGIVDGNGPSRLQAARVLARGLSLLAAHEAIKPVARHLIDRFDDGVDRREVLGALATVQHLVDDHAFRRYLVDQAIGAREVDVAHALLPALGPYPGPARRVLDAWSARPQWPDLFDRLSVDESAERPYTRSELGALCSHEHPAVRARAMLLLALPSRGYGPRSGRAASPVRR